MRRIAEVMSGPGGATALDRVLAEGPGFFTMSAAALAVITDGSNYDAVTITDPSFAAADALHAQLGEGPALDACEQMVPIFAPDLSGAGGRWPAFADAAVGCGIVAAFSFPARVGTLALGALTLYRDTAGEMDSGDLDDAAAFASITSRLLVDVTAGLTNGELPGGLDDLPSAQAHVHQAAGMASVQLGVDVAGAMAAIRASAWVENRSLDDVARDIVERTERFDAN
jgi:hypothetical protein